MSMRTKMSSDRALSTTRRALSAHEPGSRSSPRCQPLERLRHVNGAHRVERAERAAAKRRIADSEDRPDVAVARLTHHAFLERARRLVQHRQAESLHDRGITRTRALRDPEHLV